MYDFSLISNSSDNTMMIAKKLAKLLKTSDTVILSGDLGAGKTKFVEGFLSYFNIEDEICSPTFNIVNEYITPNINIYHFDVYRLNSENDFLAIGGDEYFNNGICLIEWGEMLYNLLPKDYIKISFEKDPYSENTRILNFELIGKFKENKEAFYENIKY